MTTLSGGVRRIALAAALLAPFAPAAHAADEGAMPVMSYPWLSVEIPVEVQGDFTFSSDDPAAEFNDVYPTIEPYLSLHLNEHWRAEAGLVLEPVLDPIDDRFFEDVGLYLKTLQIVWESNGLALSAGKQTPAFGVGWDIMPGIYGDELASGYELAERWGATAAYTFDLGANGQHTLSASTFFLDTSALSESAFTNRGRTSILDGGPSNTEDLSSFVVSLSGHNAFGAEGLGYHVGFSHQDSDLAGAAAERGFVAALFYETTTASGLTIAPIVECAFFDDYMTVPGSDASLCSGAVAFGRGPWSFSAGGGAADIDMSDVSFVQLTGGYEFDWFTAELGYRRLDEDGTVSHTVGVLFSRTFEWSTARR